MSASLVGSEMCIRDRVVAASADLAALAAQDQMASEGEVSKPDAQEAKACLLYTSDAADDM
eukprot:14228333-Alexandrium_andersonii.AAC.1